MTYDPNQTPRPANSPDAVEARRSGGFGWMIAALIAALVIIGAFFVWPTNDRVATTNPPGSSTSEPNATGTTTTTPASPTAPAAPSAPAAPAAPAPAAPAPSGAR
jgi:hypothetical protein